MHGIAQIQIPEDIHVTLTLHTTLRELREIHKQTVGMCDWPITDFRRTIREAIEKILIGVDLKENLPEL